MAYPTNTEIDAAVPVAGTPDRARTNAVLRALAAALPSGNSRQIVAFEPETGEMVPALFTADQWSEFPGGAPTEGIWLAAYIPGSAEVMGFAAAAVFPEENTVPVRTSENGPYTAGRLKAAAAMDPEDCVIYAQAVRTVPAAPTAADSPGEMGDFYAAPDFLYFCTAPNTWVRSATTPW